MELSITLARDLGYDVFNALDIMDNQQFLGELKFGQGDGYLHYYLFNWNTQERYQASNLGVVLV